MFDTDVTLQTSSYVASLIGTRAVVDLIEFVVSVPSEVVGASDSERLRLSGRTERRYSEFASFATRLDQLRSRLVRVDL